MAQCTRTIQPQPSPLGAAEARAVLAQGFRLVGRGMALWIGVLAGGILQAMKQARARRDLAAMDDRMLHDLALRRDDIDEAVRAGRPMDRRR